MISLTDAKAVMEDVRRDFKSGGKSGNKAYTDATGTHFAAIPTPVRLATRKAVPDRAARRNSNALFADARMAAKRREGQAKGAELTALGYGRMVSNMPIVCGNCTEMACVAAYRVAELDKHCDISIVSTDGPGDHVFCAVGPASDWPEDEPLETAVAAQRKLIIIDPWANVCCMAENYMDEFAARMGKWVGAGKRIAAGGSSWVSPDADYIARFKASTANVINARNSCPLLG